MLARAFRSTVVQAGILAPPSRAGRCMVTGWSLDLGRLLLEGAVAASRVANHWACFFESACP
eukprot:11228116-Lingulodinium_polyedra.AAC.1